jgi:hypothetical protein
VGQRPQEIGAFDCYLHAEPRLPCASSLWLLRRGSPAARPDINTGTRQHHTTPRQSPPPTAPVRSTDTTIPQSG